MVVVIIEFFEGILSALYKAVRKKNTKKKKGQTKNRNSVNSKRVDYRKNKPVTTKPTTHQENKNIITSKNNRNNDKTKDNTKPEEIISTDISATISSNPQISEKNVDIIAPEIIETNKTVLPNITGKGAVNQNEPYTKPVETVESTESLVVTPDSTEESMASNNTEESDSNDGSVLSDKTGNGEIDEEESNTEPVVTVSETVESTESLVITPDSTEEGMVSNNTEKSDSNDGSVLSDKTGNGVMDEEESNTEPVVTVSETVELTESLVVTPDSTEEGMVSNYTEESGNNNESVVSEIVDNEEINQHEPYAEPVATVSETVEPTESLVVTPYSTEEGMVSNYTEESGNNNESVVSDITGNGEIDKEESNTEPVVTTSETAEMIESLVVTPDSTEEGMVSNNTEESDNNDGPVLSDKTGNGVMDEEESNTNSTVTIFEPVEPTESIAETTNNIKSVSSHSETDSYLELESDFINQLIEADHSDNAGKLEKTNNISVVYKQDTSKRSYNKSQVTDKQLKERDKKFKKWTKSVSEMDGSDDSLLNTIIKQIKDLQNEYGPNYPLGFITLTDQEYKKLLLLCRKILLNSDVMISQYNALILTVTLVQFTIRRNDNDDFWDRFFYIIQVDDNSVFRRIFYEAIISFCVSEGLFFYYLNGKRRYIETIKIHSVITMNTYKKIIDSIESFYYEVMHENYSEGIIDERVEQYVEIMKSSIDENDKVEYGIYRLPTSFRNACDAFENAIGDAVKNTLYNINSRAQNRSSTKKTPSAFYYFYRYWLLAGYSEKHKITNRKTETNLTAKKRNNKIKVGYFLSDDYQVYVSIPRVEIPQELISEQVLLKVYNDGREITEFRQELDVEGIFSFYTEEKDIRITEFYKKLSYKIIAGKNIIYDSSEVLFRNYLVFDENCSEYRSKTVPNDNFFIAASKSDDLLFDCFSERKSSGNIVVFVLSAEDNSDICVNSVPVFRTFGNEDLNVSLIGGGNINSIKASIGNTLFRVWKTLPDIKIEYNDREKINGYSLSITGNDIGFEKELIDAFNPDGIISLKSIAEQTDELYIVIKNKNGKLIWEYPILYVPSFYIILDKKYYYKEKYAEVLDIASDNLDFSETDFPISAEINNKSDNVLYVKADKNGKKIVLQIKLPVITWTISDKLRHTTSDYIPSWELPSKSMLKINAPINDYTVIAVNNSGIKALPYKNGKADLSVIKNSTSDYTDIALSIEKEYIKLFEILHKPCIRNLNIEMIDSGDKLALSYDLFGSAKVIVSVQKNSLDEKKEIFSSTDSVSEILTPELETGRYHLIFEMEESDEFGFGTEIRQIESREIFIGDEFEVICGETDELSIDCCIIDNQNKPVNNFYVKNIKKQIDGYMYTGTAYFYAVSRYTGDYYQQEFTKANPIIIRIIEVSDVEFTVLITDSEYDGFYYNKIKNRLEFIDRSIKDRNTYDIPDTYRIRKKLEVKNNEL